MEKILFLNYWTFSTDHMSLALTLIADLVFNQACFFFIFFLSLKNIMIIDVYLK